MTLTVKSESLLSFGPVSEDSATLLILGSMPGVRSLAAGEYYAHPQNSFWRIMAQLTGLDPADVYANRLRSMKEARIALWDVLYSCQRTGSLDSEIQPESIVPNDFPAFFRQHPQIKRVCFNGGFAEQIYSRKVLPLLPPSGIEYLRLPSTSPAYTLSFEKKLSAWKAGTGRRKV